MHAVCGAELFCFCFGQILLLLCCFSRQKIGYKLSVMWSWWALIDFWVFVQHFWSGAFHLSNRQLSRQVTILQKLYHPMQALWSSAWDNFLSQNKTLICRYLTHFYCSKRSQSNVEHVFLFVFLIRLLLLNWEWNILGCFPPVKLLQRFTMYYLQCKHSVIIILS